MRRSNRKRSRRNRAADSPDSQSEGPQGSSAPNTQTSPAQELENIFVDEQNSDLERENEIVEDELVEVDPYASDDENLFGSDIENDYRADPLLDQYEKAGLDDEEYEAMDAAERREVERRLATRDRRMERGPGAILDSDDAEPLDFNRVRRRNFLQLNDNETMEDLNDEEATFTINDFNDIKAGSIAEWIAMEGPRKAISRQFKNFLGTAKVRDGTELYSDKIRQLGEANLETIEISYNDLLQNDPALAYLLINSPRLILQIFDDVAQNNVLQMFPAYEQIHSEIHCRITDVLTFNSLRDLRQNHLNCLVRVFGVVSRRSSVFPQLKYVRYRCGKCGVTLGPFYQDPSTPGEIKISNCSNCDSRGPFIFCSEQTVYRNYQKVTLQETPGSVPAGRLPRHREVILLWDLVDTVKPGDEIEVTGIYQNNMDVSLNNRHGFPVFSTVIEANYITKQNENSSFARLTEDDENQIHELARDPNIGKRIIHSIAPSIYGHMDIKTALAFALFGGCPDQVGDTHMVRGDINVLLLGDPGTAKSQFLKYAEKTAHRCVYATGQGASAVGLTASVRKDPVTREWTLEGGALVLADKGVCLIDEFDKMNEKDRTSIHEAMEQQSISISKAGIVTTLQARCSVIAAANPIRGRYNPTLPLTQNVDLTEPILSRFDCVCIVRDTVDPTLDFQLANFVLDSHDRAHPESHNIAPPDLNEDDAIKPIPQDLLRKYITYSRERCRPTLDQVDSHKITSLYQELRQESFNSGGLTIAVRHFESILRMSQAHAKMHLRDHVRADDLDKAISTFLDSFIQTQKISVVKRLRKSFSRYMRAGQDNFPILDSLLGRLATESIQLYQKDRIQESLGLDGLTALPELVKIPVAEFAARARELTIYDISTFLHSSHLTRLGYAVETFNELDTTQPKGPDGEYPQVSTDYLVSILRP